MTDHTKPNANDHALDWLVKRAAGPDPATEAAFQQWLKTSAENAEAYARISRLWEEAGSAQALDASLDLLPALQAERTALSASAPRRLPRKGQGRTAWLTGFAAAACLGLAVFSAGLIRPEPSHPEPPLVLATQTTSAESHILADGSQVTLGPESQIEVTFSNSARSATLTTGAAYFDITRDENRPFTVHAGTQTIHVLGTAFDVQRGTQSLRVSVSEGHVEVRVPGHDTQQLSVGDQLLVTDDYMERSRNNPDSVASWISGRLMYRQVPLSIIAEDLDRYLPEGSIIVSPQAGALRMTVTFETSRLQAALEAIALANGLTLTSHPDGSLEFSIPDAQ